MDRTNPEGRNQDPAPRPSSGGAVRRGPLPGLLRDLMTELDRVRRGSMPSGPGDATITLWKDDQNVYMNVDIRNEAELDFDVTVCYDKAYIRVAR